MNLKLYISLAGGKDGVMCTHWGLLQAPDSFIRPFPKPSYLCFLEFVSDKLYFYEVDGN